MTNPAPKPEDALDDEALDSVNGGIRAPDPQPPNVALPTSSSILVSTYECITTAEPAGLFSSLLNAPNSAGDAKG